MMLTLFTDASYCSQTNAAGYGAWFKRDDMPAGETFGGEIFSGVSNSSEAELYAIAYALDRLGRRGFVQHPVKRVMVQSDSSRALQIVLKLIPNSVESRHASSKLAPLTGGKDGIRATTIERGAAYIAQDVLKHVRTLVRHVKGHQEGGGRSWVNRQCDGIAYEYMQLARRRLRGEIVEARK